MNRLATCRLIFVRFSLENTVRVSGLRKQTSGFEQPYHVICYVFELLVITAFHGVVFKFPSTYNKKQQEKKSQKQHKLF